MTMYEFDQMVVEAMVKIGEDQVFECLEKWADKYGFPIPSDKWDEVILEVAGLVQRSRQ